MLSLRSNIPRYARGGSSCDAGTVFATLKQPSLRSGRFSTFRLGSLFSLRSNGPRYARGPLGRKNCCRYAPTSLASLGEGQSLGRGNCFRCAQTALAPLGKFFTVSPRVTVVASLKRPSLRSGTPRAFKGIYLGLLGRLRTISVKPRSKFQKSEKIAFRPKNAFRRKSPLYVEKTRNAAQVLKFSGVPSALAGSDRTCGDVRPTLRGAPLAKISKIWPFSFFGFAMMLSDGNGGPTFFAPKNDNS